jgi:cyclophilin family peptidyl-prolyl cis-trans isomerase/HEAT repeat protein
MRHCLIFVFLLSILCSCNRETEIVNKFSDASLVNIADLQDRRSGDSLLLFFDHVNPDYRRSAAIAFGSVQDSNYVEPLEKLLTSDADSTVRKAAAYALGQTPGLRSELALADATSKEKSTAVLSEIIQAYGKVAQSWKLNVIPADTIISQALGWGYYRMAVRGLSDDLLNENAIELLQSNAIGTRLAAAHFFARGAKAFQNFADVLIKTAATDNSPVVRMAVALALGKIISESSSGALVAIAEKDPDYRVRLNAIRALQYFPIEVTRKALITALDDSNVNVGISAAEVIKVSITKRYWKEVLAAARSAHNWRINATLFEAALFASGDKLLAEEIRTAYEKSLNVYQQAALLTALQHMPSNADFLHKQLMESKQPVIKSSAAQALVAMNHNENFDASLLPEFARFYKEAIGDGDMAVIGLVCSALADTALGYRSVIKDFNFLKVARRKLSLPRDYESVLPLEMAINYFEEKNEKPNLANDFNHPIDWHLVTKIRADQNATIKTSKGSITIRLLVEDAPGSVGNFVSLAASKYYDGRRIHRVAPNFVVQDGCPRGDGWGSEDYSIRSEFMPHPYATGSVGMASAGKDTEGTQWFITHSPTPHLEGRYTLFAEVETGMDVVHNLEIGDSIIAVEIIDFNPL